MISPTESAPDVPADVPADRAQPDHVPADRFSLRPGAELGSVGASEHAAALAQGYRESARITRRHGTTYYWGTALLPARNRRHVHALYAVCRVADDIVDLAGDGADTDVVRARLQAFADEFRHVCRTGSLSTSSRPTDSDSAVNAGSVSDSDSLTDADSVTLGSAAIGSTVRPEHANILLAGGNTVRLLDLPPENFDRFFSAMFRDLTDSRYATWEDLCGYMEGSAAVIGEMVLPALMSGRSPDRVDAARDPARQLGFAFQLTNFLRDVGEDLDRGRVYIPQEDLERFGVDIDRREVTPEWKQLMAFEIERNRELYRLADAGVPMLSGSSARCVRAARQLYSEILDRIEAADYDVFSARARVPTARKIAVAARSFTGR